MARPSARENRRVRVTAFYAYLAAAGAYLAWRIGSSVPWRQGRFETVVAVAYAVVEVVMLMAGCRILSLLRGRVQRSAEADQNLDWWRAAGAPSPLIDVLIPTYNEPEAVVEKGIAGAKHLHYDNYRIWLLDDGGRPAMQALADRMGVRYIVRAQRSGAKAGILNHGLAHLRALDRPPAFVSVIDSDVVAQPELLRRLLALLKDPTVGLAQTPQFFWNPDPVQAAFPHGSPLADDLRFSFDTIHMAQDARGRASCRGTSFLARFQAMLDIGGFPTESVNEDVLTSQRLRAKQWKTVYLEEQLSYGLAAEDLHQFLTQRRRYSTGFAQIGVLGWQNRAASLWRRLAAVEVNLRWQYTNAAQALLIFGPPLCYGLFGARPLQGAPRLMVLLGLPLWLAFRAYITWFTEGRNVPVFREANLLLQMPALSSGAVLGFWRARTRRFLVTGKGLRRGQVVIYGRMLAWLAALVGLTGGSVAWRLLHGAVGSDPFAVVMGGWALYACVVGTLAMCICIERPNRRADARFPGRGERVRLTVGDRDIDVRLEDISCTGALVEAPASPVGAAPLPASGATVRFALAGLPPMDATVVRRAAPGRWALRFAVSGGERERLICAVVSPRFVAPVIHGSFTGAVAAAARRLTRVRSAPAARAPASDRPDSQTAPAIRAAAPRS